MKDSTKDRAAGKFHEVKGRLKQKAGRRNLDPALEAEGKDEKRTGKVQKVVGKVEKALGD